MPRSGHRFLAAISCTMTKRSQTDRGTRRGKAAPKNALRIVSLAPSSTSILCAIGARETLVGVTKWCPDIADVGNLPQLGDCWQMDNIDEILALKPTLVIGSVPFQQETVAKLLAQPLNFLAKNPRSLADIERDILLLGRIASRSAAADRLVHSMRREFATISRKSLRALRSKPRPRVYAEAWSNPRISSPPWVAELIALAGGEMAVPPGETVTDEQVAIAMPDVIVLAWAATGARADPAKSYSVAAWRNVPAVLLRRVHVVSDELLNTPGPPLIAGARELFQILHPSIGGLRRPPGPRAGALPRSRGRS
jgi:iron complex transport system substrate-binding protein